jgi:hypothetical protein
MKTAGAAREIRAGRFYGIAGRRVAAISAARSITPACFWKIIIREAHGFGMGGRMILRPNRREPT